MTNSISSGLPPQSLADASQTAALRPGNSGISNNTAGAAGTEAVTVSAEAQSRTMLLDASRTSSGVDAPAVAQLRAAVQSNSYNVPPEDLATAIATALKERQS